MSFDSEKEQLAEPTTDGQSCFDSAKEQLAALTPDGRSWVDGDGYLDLRHDGQSHSLGLGIVGDEDDDKAYLLARVVIFAFEHFSEKHNLEPETVLEAAATALGLPDGLDCQVDIIVYDGQTDDKGDLVPVEDEGEVDVDTFEVLFSPEKSLDQLDENLLRTLIEGAPYILPTED